ncbi:hypothetical protein ACVW0Y_000923 [Pseudomonas sp. TE3786]
MDASRNGLLGVALSVLVVAGCTSKITEEDQYSGYLDRYDVLQPTVASSGEPTLRWVAPDFSPAAFDTVLFDGLELYPAPRATDRINANTFQQLQQTTNQAVVKALSSRYRVITTLQPTPAGARVLVLQAAITGVSASPEGMRWYEVLPVTAVLGGISAATGQRDQNSELYVEAMLLDPHSHQPVVRAVRKVFGKKLANDAVQISPADFNQAINALSSDLSGFIR